MPARKALAWSCYNSIQPLKTHQNLMFPTTFALYSMPVKPFLTQESNYSNIECEMPGVVFSILHFKCFTFGRKVHVITDHKPLITLFRKNLHATSLRLSHMLVQILDYNIEFHHQEDTKMHLSDALSRLNTHDSDAEKSKAKPLADFNVTIHNVEILTGFKSLSLDQI